MKKLISFLLCTMMAFSAVSGIAFRDTSFDTAITAEAAETTLEKSMLPYYYSLMSDTEKSWYLQMRTAVINKESSVKLKGSVTSETIQKLANTMFYYDVLTFNLNSITGGTISANGAKINFAYKFNKESYDKMIEKMNTVANSIIAKFDDDTSTYAKIKYIHDYLIKKTEYTETEQTAHYAYGPMVRGKGVCEGYAQAFAFICRKAGIQTVNVIGTSRGESHMWNKVYYNKKWYNVDVTWDDPVSNIVENISYNYFMVSDEVINKDHTPDECEYKIPSATDDSKSYYKMYKLTASTNNEAKALLINQTAKAATKGKSVVTIQLENQSAFNSFESYINKNNCEALFDVLKSAAKKTDAELITNTCNFSSDSSSLTFTIMVYRKGTSLSDYFSDTSSVDSGTKKTLKGYGITID